MTDPDPLNVRMRRIGMELARLRKESGLSGGDVERILGISRSTLSRVETCERAVRRDDLSALLVVYKAPRHFRDALLKLHEDSDQPSLVEDLELKVNPDLETWIGFEQDAIAIDNYQHFLVPGLCQIGDYARAVIAGGPMPLEQSEVDRRVRARIARQGLLRRQDGPELRVLLHEAALRQNIGGSFVMREQLRHLEALAGQPRIEVRIVPDAIGAQPGLDGGTFTILDFNGLSSLVHVEHVSRALYMEERVDVDRYKVAFNAILATACSMRESVELIRRAGEGLR